MLNPKVKMTVRDYMSLPESEEKRYELIDGELYMVPAPTFWHQKISGRLFKILIDFVLERGLGEVAYAPLDVVLSDQDVFQPDIMFVSVERAGIIGSQIRGAPDLVVEVLSPGTAERDRNVKRSRYARFGVREYWIVDPEARSIEIMQAGETGFEIVRVYPQGVIAASPLLEGLRIDVSHIFADIPS